MSYRIGKVSYRNFMPFEDAEVDFSLPGVTAVEGVVVGRPGCDSNGSGKSALLDGVAWCLFDRCIRPQYRGDDVIRGGSSGGCCVTVELSGGEHGVTVSRYRGHPDYKDRVYLFVGGEDVTAGTNAETDRVVARQVGCDFDGFVNGVAFCARADVRRFFVSTDAERKETLERVLGLDLYADAERDARKALHDVLADLEAAGAAVDAARAEHAAKSAVLARFGDEDRMADAELALKNVRIGYKYAQVRRRKSEEAVAKAAKAKSAAKSAYEAEYNAYAVKRDENQKLAADASAAADKAVREQGKLEGRMLELKSRVAKLEKLTAVAECPTCGRPVDKVKAKALAGVLTKAAGAAGASSDAMAMEAELCRRSVPAAPVAPSRQALDDADAALTAATFGAKADAAVESQHDRRVRDAEAEFKAAAAKVKQTRTELEKIEADIEAIEVRRAEAGRRVSDLELWVEGFGNRGLKAFLIEAEIPHLNALATSRAQAFLGEGARVTLSATRELKARKAVKEELTVSAVIPGMARKYAGASNGQKTRLDLSLLMAMRDMAAHRASGVAGGIDQLFADELFDGLDASGSVAVADMLREIAESHPVILVTHDARLRDVGDRIVTVTHDGDCEAGCATVSTSDAEVAVAAV